jgi:hypothetical protein
MHPSRVGSYTVLPGAFAPLSGGSGTGAGVSPYWTILTMTVTNAGANYGTQTLPLISWSSGLVYQYPILIPVMSATAAPMTLNTGVQVDAVGNTAISPTIALNAGSGAVLTVGDSVIANSSQLLYSYQVGAASGALAVYGLNYYLNAAGTASRTNTAKNGWAWQHDTRATNDSAMILRVISSGGSAVNAVTFDTGGGITSVATVTGLTIRTGASSGPTWTTGTGAPASTQPVGSLYSNTSGAAGARLYVSAGGGTWTAVAGV